MAGVLAVTLIIARLPLPKLPLPRMPLPTWHLRSSGAAAQMTPPPAAGADGLLVRPLDGSAAPAAFAALPQDQRSDAGRSDGAGDGRTISDLDPLSRQDGDEMIGPAPSLPPAGESVQAALPARQLTGKEIAALLERGREYVRSADIAAARLLFQRAAESGDPQAALALGATYDPATLEEIGLEKFYSDIAQARTWYEQARELGSPGAIGRLKRLANQAP